MKKSKVVLLDECTSNVDLEMDEVVQRVIRSEFGGCTVLVVAHRLGSIMDSDAVVVVEQGRIVEYGPPRLLVRKQSRFRELHG